MNLSSSKLKKLLLSFLREPLRVFITISSDFFYLTIHFYCCFRVFSLLTAFVHFTKFTGFYHCFLRCFYFTTDFDYFFGWFDLINILSSFLYCLATCSADLREHFWFSGVFFPYSPSQSLAEPAFIKTSSRQFLSEGCGATHWGLKYRPGPSVCLNHTVFSKRY